MLDALARQRDATGHTVRCRLTNPYGYRHARLLGAQTKERIDGFVELASNDGEIDFAELTVLVDAATYADGVRHRPPPHAARWPRVGTTPVGGEETELCIRVGAHDATHRILFDPDMAVHHRVSEDRATLRYFLRRCYHEGLSKAVVSELAAQLATGHTALSSEATYVREVLPRAVARELASLRRDGLIRAGLIVAGLLVTTAGYLRATAHRRIFPGAHR